ncbi:MAG: bifunctional hydroxymethylpyrimidine kinase/phosphomethylpyrimidine kinase, partial [Alistipes sp.]|nr:bifunctional hydroxymethylpyrimidine kinase/phosphomethylpyrimidine kinase [Candidatus Minthomonas equi]
LYAVTPNETESELLTGVKVTDEKSALEASEVFISRGVKRVVITMGSKGAFVNDGQLSYLVPARKVKAVDTTAAGDTYNGAMCVALAEGKTLKESLEFATKASAIAVTRMGAQPSIPTREELDSTI